MMTAEERRTLIQQIRDLPSRLEVVVASLTEKQLTTHYLAGEWNVAQNVHHLADTHMVIYVRMKLILTEDRPLLKPFNQDVWAAQPDAATAVIQPSLQILHGLHQRWADMLDSAKEEDWQRVGIHPERGELSLERTLQVYSGHGQVHIQQIQKTLGAAGGR